MPIDRREFGSVAGLVACAVAIEGGLLAVLLRGRPADHVPEFLLSYLLLSVPYLTACWLVTGRPGSRSSRIGMRWIWVAALVFRVTALPLDPSLSEDSVRYRWQGLLQDAGGDPYTAIPEDRRWSGLRDETWDRVSTKDKPSAYGPLQESVHLWTYRLASRLSPDPSTQVWLFKIPAALADLATGMAAVSLLAALGMSRRRALVYLWSPLSVTEFWIEGHYDSIALAFVVAALALSARGRVNWALGLLSAGIMAKFWPVVLAPFLLVSRAGRRWRFEWTGMAAAAGVAILLCLPYWGSVHLVRDVLTGLTGGWRNNDSLFGLLVFLCDGNQELAATIGRWLLASGVLLIRSIRLPAMVGELAALCLMLLLAANCFPWYLTWMLPLLAVHTVPALLLWTASVSLAYHVVPMYEANGTWVYDGFLTVVEYLPVLGLLAGRSLAWTVRRRRRLPVPRRGQVNAPARPDGR